MTGFKGLNPGLMKDLQMIDGEQFVRFYFNKLTGLLFSGLND